MQTPIGPSQNIFLPEMRDLISALVTDCSLDPYVGHHIQDITIAMQSFVVHRQEKRSGFECELPRFLGKEREDVLDHTHPNRGQEHSTSLLPKCG